MFSAFFNCLKIPELRSRIFYTLSLLFIARVGAHIPLPGIDPTPLEAYFKTASSGTGPTGNMMSLYNMFTGGALLKGAVCALGIMPYISASIIFQLMTAVMPSLSRLAQEGDVGRQKLTQWTRYATVLICLVQGTHARSWPWSIRPNFSAAISRAPSSSRPMAGSSSIPPFSSPLGPCC